MSSAEPPKAMKKVIRKDLARRDRGEGVQRVAVLRDRLGYEGRAGCCRAGRTARRRAPHRRVAIATRLKNSGNTVTPSISTLPLFGRGAAPHAGLRRWGRDGGSVRSNFSMPSATVATSAIIAGMRDAG